MLIQLGSLRSSIALLPGLMGPRAKKKTTETTSVACRKREVQDAQSSYWMLNQRLLQRWRERERETGRRRGERCSVCLRKREKEKGGVSRERAIVVHKHTCRHRKKPKDGEEKRISCTAHTQAGIQIQGAAHAHHNLTHSPTLQKLTSETSNGRCWLFLQR